MSGAGPARKLPALLEDINTLLKLAQLILSVVLLGLSTYRLVKELQASGKAARETLALPQNIQPEALSRNSQPAVCFNRLEELLEESQKFSESQYMVAGVELNHVDEETSELLATQSLVLLTVNTGRQTLVWNMPTSGYIPAHPEGITNPHDAMVRQQLEAMSYEATEWAVQATADVVESYTGRMVRTGAMFPVSLDVFNVPGMPGTTDIIDMEKRIIRRREAGGGST